MKLWVDDLRAAPEGWWRATTVTEAIRALATQPCEEVSLDHDIACYAYIGSLGVSVEHSIEETFEGVAWYIAAMKTRPSIIHLHTANPWGAKAMAGILGLPFPACWKMAVME